MVGRYVNNSQGITDESVIISKCQDYASIESEVGILARSFKQMIRDLKVYIDNLEKVTAEKERINTELDVARRIQTTLLPKKFPDRDEYQIYAQSIPAKKVGGDFYDFFLVDDDHLALVMADVSDKGMPAALFMVVAKTMLKNQALLDKKPAPVFETVNNQLNDGNDENMFVTAWMGLLEIKTGKLIYVNAGHTNPLIKQAGKDYRPLKSKPGFVLGGLENIKYEELETKLQHGDKLFLYTDGITEAMNKEEELFGELKLQQIINERGTESLKETCDYIHRRIKTFVKDQEQQDDITMLILQYHKK
jgi:sigma-B regulation protein RsbU (phosphoserine phosphatase)